ncbi:hemolysin expression modulator Hha [Enterobacter sp. KBR-315C3_2022]|uniref:hemolysin expression modulator Hha n=1 Tax=Enterobacter sp. KBR-315C3_2022 TaxID=3242494 RepID=UPI0035294479
MTKMDWLLKLRKVRELDTLEKIIDKKKYELTDAELAIFWGAADHRLAELTMNRIFDRVPADIWRFII